MERPIEEMLQRYESSGTLRLHMPGHKGTHGAHDVTELSATDNLYAPGKAITQAQILLAEQCGAKKSYLLTGGASLGIAAMIASAVLPGQELIVAENSHRSVWDACALCDINVHVLPLKRENGLFLPPDENTVAESLEKYRNAAALLITSPDYYGLCAQLKPIGALCKKYGVKLLIDQAHGAHFPYYSSLLPYNGCSGADAWVHSLHKTIGALTQSAALHLSDLLLSERAEFFIQLLGTSSPSFLLLESMDCARAEYAAFDTNGFLARVQKLEDEISDIPGISVLQFIHKDPTRLCIDTSAICAGFEAAKQLEEQGVIPEMADLRFVVCILTPYDGDYTRLLCALKQLHKTSYFQPELPFFCGKNERVKSVREAAFAKAEYLPLAACSNRIAACCAGVYPPGIPAVVYGEKISEQTIHYLLNVQKNGQELFGLQNGRLRVIAENS